MSSLREAAEAVVCIYNDIGHHARASILSSTIEALEKVLNETEGEQA